MTSVQTKTAFTKSDKGRVLRKQLQAMVKSPLYNTRVSTLTTDPSGARFIEKHMSYMSGFPKMDHFQYISNIKLMTKIILKRNG